MRKRIIDQVKPEVRPAEAQWLNLQLLAQVEITSEEDAFPIEAALIPGSGAGWRAARPGKQTIRLLFDEPLHLRQLRLVFEEEEQPRTQEFVLSWSADGGQSYREIVRQQYHFSPPDTRRELEDYNLNLHGVTALELNIVPDLSQSQARASLAQLRLA